MITLNNPLNKPITITEKMINCSEDNIFVKPLPLKIPEHQERNLDVVYRPLVEE